MLFCLFVMPQGSYAVQAAEEGVCFRVPVPRERLGEGNQHILIITYFD